MVVPYYICHVSQGGGGDHVCSCPSCDAPGKKDTRARARLVLSVMILFRLSG
jgi:hypothetical protein